MTTKVRVFNTKTNETILEYFTGYTSSNDIQREVKEKLKGKTDFLIPQGVTYPLDPDLVDFIKGSQSWWLTSLGQLQYEVIIKP